MHPISSEPYPTRWNSHASYISDIQAPQDTGRHSMRFCVSVLILSLKHLIRIT